MHSVAEIDCKGYCNKEKTENFLCLFFKHIQQRDSTLVQLNNERKYIRELSGKCDALVRKQVPRLNKEPRKH